MSIKNLTGQPRRTAVDSVPVMRGTTLRFFSGHPEYIGKIRSGLLNTVIERQLAEFVHERTGERSFVDIRTGTMYEPKSGMCLSSDELRLIGHPRATGNLIPKGFYKEGEGAIDAPLIPIGEEDDA